MHRSPSVRHGLRWMVAALTILGLILAAIIARGVLTEGTETAAETAGMAEPAIVKHIEGSDLSQVILTEKAAERLGIETAPVRDEQVGGMEQKAIPYVRADGSGDVPDVQVGAGTQRKVIPYSAVLYGTNGEAWAYTNPEPLVFVRHAITVERIEGDLAILLDGPPADTQVVTVGVAELFGTEFGVGH